MNSCCRVVLLLVCLGVAVESAAPPNPFQLLKWDKHFDVADADKDGQLTVDDYRLIANRTLVLPGYTKYTYAVFNATIVQQAWNAFPGTVMNKVQYVAAVTQLLIADQLAAAVKKLAPIMFEIWTWKTVGSMSKEELRGEFEALVNLPVDVQTNKAFAKLAVGGAITKQQYEDIAVDYFTSADSNSSSQYFFGYLTAADAAAPGARK